MIQQLLPFVDECVFEVVRESDNFSQMITGLQNAQVEAYLLAINSQRHYDVVNVIECDTVVYTAIRDGLEIQTTY